MKNLDLKVEGDILVIKINLNERGAKSSSGKSVIVASSEGNVSVPGREEFKLGLNVYTPVK